MPLLSNVPVGCRMDIMRLDSRCCLHWNSETGRKTKDLTMKPRIFLTALLAILGVTALSARADDTPWQKVLEERLSIFGGRNWIVIADAAYPAQSSEGVEIISADAPQIEVVKTVLSALADTKVLNANVITTAELKYIAEQDAPGITTFREGLSQLLTGREASTLTQDHALTKVDEASRSVRVLVIKTNSILPYSSVFLQLAASYWSADAEKRLRESMPAASK